ncbi:MAG: metallophosphoesterase family protein [Bacilli bacterium]
MASKIKVNLDVGKDNFILVKCKQNDDISLECNVFENGVSIDLTNYSVGINARKSDNTFIIQNTDIVKKNNNIVAQLFRDFSRLPGLTLIEVILTKEGRFNTSFNINLEVIPSVTYEAIKKSSNTVTITEELQDITTNATLVRDELDALIKAGNVATKDEVNLKANQTEVDTINTELNNKANKTEINQLADGKLDKTQLNDTQTTNNNIWSAEKVNQMISAIPKGEKGDPGTASTSIDDSVTNTTQTWSSQKIYDETLPYYKSVYTSIYPVQGTKIHFEEVNEDIYMSFTTIRMAESSIEKNITFDNCKADIPNKIATSPLGKECVKLLNGECFAYDMSANKIVVVNYRQISKNQLPIFCNVNGECTLGHLNYDYLNDKILKTQNLIEHNNDLWYISQLLYIETDSANYCNYIKWDELIRKSNEPSRNFSWAELKADINDASLFVTTPSGETDCLKVDYDYALVFDILENKIKIVNRNTGYIHNRYTLLLFAPWGRIERGILAEIYTFNKFPDMYKNYEFLNELAKGNVLVPGYWRKHISDKIKVISDLQSVAGVNEVSFGMITDMHIGDNSGNSGILLEKVMKECNITYFINGGDYVSGAGIVSKENIIEDIRNCYKTFSRIIDRQLIAFGNHDASYGVNNNYDSQLSNGEIYNYIFRENQRRSDIVSSPNGTYYYADDKINKIRYIILNSQDVPTVNNQNGTVKPENNAMGNYVIRQEQFSWLIESALQTPNDTWSIVVCTHISPRHNVFVNADILMKTLDAYKYKKAYSGTSVAGTRADLQVSVNCDFTGKGGNVVAVISGHMHEDKINTAHNTDIQLIETLNDSMNVWDKSPVKTKGTTTEQAFDIFTINKITRTVNITRIGAGENRQFTY